MPLNIIRQDISRVRADAIVNSANPLPVVGRGVDSALHAAAGPRLLEDRRRIGSIKPGEAAVTAAGNLPARVVVHTVGPVWEGGGRSEAATLRNCYVSSLDAARRAGCASIAFPLISTGTYGFPKDLALRVAKRAIEDYLGRCDMDVMLVVYDEESFQLSRALSQDVESFIASRSGMFGMDSDDSPFVPADRIIPGSADFGGLPSDDVGAPEEVGVAEKACFSARMADFVPTCAAAAPVKRSLDDVVSQVGESFAEALLRMIDERGLADPEVYRRANIDRKLFSKIRNNPAYQPKKGTAIGLAVALRLDIDDTLDLIGRAGYTLSDASVGDLIVRYFIERDQWDVNDINIVLFKYDQPLIGR